MLNLTDLKSVRGNSTILYSIQILLDKKSFPKFSIFGGHMGVGKTSTAKIVANLINKTDTPVSIYNFAVTPDIKAVEEEVFKMNPSVPRAVIFEEIQELSKSDQAALLPMLDTQPSNMCIIATTTELFKLQKPLKSRAQCWDFKLLSEKQLSFLLDDYIAEKGVTIAPETKTILLRASRGVPRDLLKSIDFALAGEFNTGTLNALLGNISDDLMFSIFISLKNPSVEFVTAISELLEDTGNNKLSQIRDFWLRFLLERWNIENKTLDQTKIKTLLSLYSNEELEKITRSIIRATADTLLLELVNLNMILTSSNNKEVVGQQRAKKSEAETQARTSRQQVSTNASPAFTSKQLAQLRLE